MLLVIDVGNTNMVLGVYSGSQLLKDWRVHTERSTTEDEFNVLINSLFSVNHIHPHDVDRTYISCVVPPMVTILDAFCQKYLGHAPQWVDAQNCAGMPIRTKNPAEVGADRITATTFDAISEKGEYLGGAISPGIGIASEALFRKASKLPRVEIFVPPAQVIGKDTIGSIKSGIIFGYAGLVDGIVQRMKTEMGTDPKVIATGGLAELLFNVSGTIEAVEPALTLEGLRIIANQASA
jgi:type III pantothenate kinase